MRSALALSLLLLLLPASALAKAKDLTAQRFAKGVAKALRKGDAKTFEACCHPDFWGAPEDNGALLWKQLNTAGLSVELLRREQEVVGERSLLPLRLSKEKQVLGEFVLRIDYRNDRWGISAADEAKPAHREWLAGGLKSGTAKTAAEAVGALLAAIAAKDKAGARKHATEAGWHPPGDTLFSLYDQSVRKELVLTLKGEVRVEGERALAVIDVARKGRSVDELLLYLTKRQGWLVAGIDEDEEHGQRFLAGSAAAEVWPSSARRLAYAFGAWRDSRQEFRSLWSESGWKAAGQKLFERLGAADPRVSTSPRDRDLPSGSRVVIAIQTFPIDESATFPPEEPSEAPKPLETILLLAEPSPAGWRFVGSAADAAEAWAAGNK